MIMLDNKKWLKLYRVSKNIQVCAKLIYIPLFYFFSFIFAESKNDRISL